MDIAVSPTFSLSIFICLPLLTLIAILTSDGHHTCFGLKTEVSLVKIWAWGCGCGIHSVLLVLSILHFSKQINGGNCLWFTLNLLLRISYRCAIAEEYCHLFEVPVNNQDAAPALTQRWRKYALYTFILFSLVILIPRTLRGTSSSFSFYRNDLDFGTTFGIILLEVLSFIGFTLRLSENPTLRYVVIWLLACGCMLAGLQDASIQSKSFMIFLLLLPFLRILFWAMFTLPEVASTSGQPPNEAEQKSLEPYIPVAGPIAESANIDLENLPPSRESQPSLSSPEPDSPSTKVPAFSDSITEVDPALIIDRATTEQDTRLQWREIKKRRRKSEREKAHRGDRVDSRDWMPDCVDKNLPPSRESQPSPSSPETDSLSREDNGQRQQATIWVPPFSNSIMEADPTPIDDCAMAESEQNTILQWKDIQQKWKDIQQKWKDIQQRHQEESEAKKKQGNCRMPLKCGRRSNLLHASG